METSESLGHVMTSPIDFKVHRERLAKATLHDGDDAGRDVFYAGLDIDIEDLLDLAERAGKLEQEKALLLDAVISSYSILCDNDIDCGDGGHEMFKILDDVIGKIYPDKRADEIREGK